MNLISRIDSNGEFYVEDLLPRNKHLYSDGFPVFQPNYNMNSASLTQTNQMSFLPNSIQTSPITHQLANFENGPISTFPFLARDESSSLAKASDFDFIRMLQDDAPHKQCDELLQSIVDSSCAINSTPFKAMKNSEKQRNLEIDLNKTPEQKPPKRRQLKPTTAFSEEKLSNFLCFPVDESLSLYEEIQENPVTIILDEASKKRHDELLKDLTETLSADIPILGGEMKELEKGSDQVIDLNKTPEQKTPKRRKHRPKVITEGKPKRSSKSEKPKDTKETPSVKRKYVRKKGIKESATPHVNVEKIKDLSTAPKTNSCRRTLKFDREKTGEEDLVKKQDGKDLQEGNMGNIFYSARPNITDLCTQSNGVCSVNSDVHVIHQDGMMAENVQPSIQGNVADMNQMMTPFRSQFEKVAAADPSCKSAYFNTGNLLNDRRIIDQRNADQYQNGFNYGYVPAQQHIHADGTEQFVNQGLRGSTCSQTAPRLLCNTDEARGSKRSVNAINPVGLIAQMLAMLSRHNRSNQSTKRQDNSTKEISGDRYINSVVYGNKFQRQPISHEPHPKVDRRCKINELAKIISYDSLNTFKKCNGLQPFPYLKAPEQEYACRHSDDIMLKKRQSDRPILSKLGSLATKKVQEQGYSFGFQKLTDKTTGLLVYEISRRLKDLSLNENERINRAEQNAIVPYKGSGAVIPYVESEYIKKRKSRPRVELDLETERIWNLLMGKEGIERLEDHEKGKEKWWEEERKVFRGRADSFIARMHLVQGDRRFSQWKGSVVDSVIGVFLTQNVSDHLSSSAFMSLAARFPVKSTGKNKTQGGTGMSIVTNESTTCQLYPENSIRWDGLRSCSGSNSEAEDPIVSYNSGSINFSNFMNTKPTATTTMSQKSLSDLDSSTLDKVAEHRHGQLTDGKQDSLTSEWKEIDDLNGHSLFDFLINIGNQEEQVQSSNSHLHMTPDCGVLEVEGREAFSEDNISSGLSTASGSSIEKNSTCHSLNIGELAETLGKTRAKENEQDRSQETARMEHGTSKYPVHLRGIGIQSESHCGQNLHLDNYGLCERNKTFSLESALVTDPSEESVAPAKMQQTSTLGNAFHVPAHREKSLNYEDRMPRESNQINFANSDGNFRTEKVKRRKVDDEKKNTVDWDSLRKQVEINGLIKEKTKDTMDSIDYEAIRLANVHEISDAIKERGMNNMLAERIKGFLNRLVSEHGSIDLEWLRDVPPDKTKDYLLSVRGLGLKSVECVRLLTLRHLAFPVDTNVGRIAVRLGWVPLKPLPESLQLHLLELYPVLESIQKYLWPRLCKLDQRTLYELHYQLITFGKVFCTKSKPNCNACPMRGECKHFASAFASARLALPGPDEKRVVSSTIPIAAEKQPAAVISRPLPILPAETSTFTENALGTSKCEPIVEVPATPEQEANEIYISDIEDSFYDDSDEIPTIKLSLEEFKTTLQNYIPEGEMSKALVALNPAAASLPTAKLKNVSRLRTEHRVYELPDSHPLLNGMEIRQPDDPSPYLLAIWTPGETADSIQPPEQSCGSEDLYRQCNQETCFTCSSRREANSQTVRGTLLVPCRTAMRGSFPLNGTYFQVNEMFADHNSSVNPIDVPRAWLWNLPRRMVYFGTSVSTIFRGLTTEEIQQCFWRGFVCVRGFDQESRSPRPLMARLHFPASKLAKLKNG